MNCIVVEGLNPDTSFMLQTLAFKKGFSWGGGDKTPSYLNRKEIVFETSVNDKRMYYNPVEDDKLTWYNFEYDLDSIIEFLGEASQVVLNSEYTAIVSPDGVKVGCQTFPLSVIDDLMEAKKNLG